MKIVTNRHGFYATRKWIWPFTLYNTHNGYYSHDAYLIKKTDGKEEVLDRELI